MWTTDRFLRDIPIFGFPSRLARKLIHHIHLRKGTDGLKIRNSLHTGARPWQLEGSAAESWVAEMREELQIALGLLSKARYQAGKVHCAKEQTIIHLHALLGNRWSAIATHLPKRTDNEIKNYCNTHLKKRLLQMGIDPMTHKPKAESIMAPGVQSSNGFSNLSHTTQWESARLEAESRLGRESKLKARGLWFTQLRNVNAS